MEVKILRAKGNKNTRTIMFEQFYLALKLTLFSSIVVSRLIGSGQQVKD